MSEPTFTREATTNLYWADPAAPVAGFLATDAAALGANPTLTLTWGDQRGSYLFLPEPAEAGFLAALIDWLARFGGGERPRFLWIANPAEPPTAWSVTELFTRNGIVAGADFVLRNYRVVVHDGSTVAPGTNGIDGWCFVLGDSPSAPALTLYSPQDRFPARAASSVLSMEDTGAWRFALDLPDAEGDAFLRLRAGMRYFSPGDGGFVDAVHFRVVSQPGGVDLTLHGQVDPLRPLDGNRTFLGFFDRKRGGSPPALPSGYSTAYGHAVTLQPLPLVGTGLPTPARLVFALAPRFTGESTNHEFYLVPDGPFGIGGTASPGAAADELDRVICGTSGLEYLGVPAAADCALTFVPGQPAFAPLGSETTGGDALTALGTTSWVRVDSQHPTTVRYYSQPEDAPLFAATRGGSSAADGALDLLSFLEIPAAELEGASPIAATPIAVTPIAGAPLAATHGAFPMAPFRGLAERSISSAIAIEQLALAPRRRAALVNRAPNAEPDAAALATDRIGVTPQGLGIGVAGDGVSWTWLGIGHTDVSSAVPDLRFTVCDGPFQQAMQTNNLFLVLGNATEFAKHGSVAFLLTTGTLDVIAMLPPQQGVRPAVLARVRLSMAGRPYATRSTFRDALVAAAPDITEAEQLAFLRFGGRLTPVVGGWPFRLSPDNWGPATYLIVKFVLGRTVADLVTDVSTWAWPEAAGKNGDPAEAQRQIAATIADAQGEPDTSPYADFVKMVNDPNWTGVMALSVEVPLSELPGEIQVLAAGIDPARFRAHHFGMSVTPYQLSGGQVAFQRSSMFGLIDYRNPEDQYFSENIAFAFRVLHLTIGIRNSVVTTFTSRAELLINRLFGAPARLFPTTHGNNIILDGALQRQQLPDGSTHDTYVFSMSGQNLFRIDGRVLESVELLAAQLVTAKASDPATGDSMVQAVFQLSGNLRYYEAEGFDPFCWGPAATDADDGYLRFGNLAISMTFSLANPTGTTVFRLNDGNLSFDAANSKARPNSLTSRFPIRLAGLITTADPALTAPAAPPPPQTPDDMGFVSVTAPIQQAALTQPWYGLLYSIDLGTLGVQAGNTAIALQVLVGWSPGATGTEPAVYVGVKLPGIKDALGVSLPLQGVVKIGFKGIELLVDNEEGKPRTYTLRMRDFALRLLGLAFPPGHNDVVLFGNPDQSGSSKVGWYLAYASDEDPKLPSKSPNRETVQRLRASVRGGKRG